MTLDQALERWRVQRHPLLAAAIRGLDAARPSRKAPRRSDDFDALWREVAAAPDTEDVGWLAETVATKVPMESGASAFDRDYVPRRYHALLQRIEVLGVLEADPRITWALANLVLEGKQTCGYEEAFVAQLYGPMLDVLAASDDPSVLPLLQLAHDAPRSPSNGIRAVLPKLVAPVLEQLAAVVVSEPDDLRALQARWGRRTSAQDPGELLDAILQDPTDLELREVYADVLQQNGDPRGEFIALQLRGDDASEKKAAKLFRKHRSDWLGPLLTRVLSRPEMREGFLHTAQLAGNARASWQEWDAAALDPRLATLQALWIGSSNHQNYVAFLTSPVLRTLSAFEVPSRAAFEAVLAGPNAGRARTVCLRFLPRRAELEALMAAMPDLQELTIKSSRSALEGHRRVAQPLWERGVTVRVYGVPADLAASFGPDPD